MYAMSTSMENASMGSAAPRSQSHQPTIIRRPLANCPTCGSGRLEPVVDFVEEGVRFLCTNCDRCWHVELGYVQRVQPGACHGCTQRERCMQVYALDQVTG
jgi:formate dehydrogenase maturation protein FdhE